MTPFEFAKRMNEIKEKYHGDPESTHSSMDSVMCDLLIELGYEFGVSIFLNSEKWYA